MVHFFSRSNLIMTHTLTAFMQLMDHGIVSWENLSSIFIKKVLARQPPSATPLWIRTRHSKRLFWRSHPAHLPLSPSPPLPALFQIASFVNAKLTDASIQQVSLDILESMVQSSHSLFLQVKQEVTMERLVAHLQV